MAAARPFARASIFHASQLLPHVNSVGFYTGSVANVCPESTGSGSSILEARVQMLFSRSLFVACALASRRCLRIQIRLALSLLTRVQPPRPIATTATNCSCASCSRTCIALFPIVGVQGASIDSHTPFAGDHLPTLSVDEVCGVGKGAASRAYGHGLRFRAFAVFSFRDSGHSNRFRRVLNPARVRRRRRQLAIRYRCSGPREAAGITHITKQVRKNLPLFKWHGPSSREFVRMQSKTSPQLSILRQWIVRLAFIGEQVPNWKAVFSQAWMRLLDTWRSQSRRLLAEMEMGEASATCPAQGLSERSSLLNSQSVHGRNGSGTVRRNDCREKRTDRERHRGDGKRQRVPGGNAVQLRGD